MARIIIEPDVSSEDESSPKHGINLTQDGATLILNRHLSKSCTKLELLNRGFNNKTYIVTDEDGTDRVIRLSGSLWTKMKTEGEIAGIMYLAKKCPNIPLPKILGFCSSRELSGVNAEYMLVEKLPGKPLDDFWPKMELPARLDMAKQVAGIFVQMKQLTFNQIGSFVLPKEVSDTQGIGFNMEDLNVDEISIGQVMEKKIGPYADTDYLTYFRDHCSVDIQDLKKSEFLKPQLQNLSRIEEFIKIMTNKETTKFELDTYEKVPITFHHGDFEARNMLVDENNIITGIVDFEFSGAFPIDNEWMESMGFLGTTTAEWRMFNEIPKIDSDTPDPELIKPVKEFVLKEIERLSGEILPSQIPGHDERALMYYFVNNICPWYLSEVTEPAAESKLEDRAASIRRIEIVLEKYGF